MSHLLDTNICSAHFRRPAGLAHQFLQHADYSFLLSFWESCMRERTTLMIRIHYLRGSPIYWKTSACSISITPVPKRFGEVRGTMLRQGISIPTADLMIGAVALVHESILKMFF